MERKTNINQFTFLASKEQAAQLEEFCNGDGGIFFDVKLKLLPVQERPNYEKVHLTFYNCGHKVAARKMAEFILNSFK